MAAAVVGLQVVRRRERRDGPEAQRRRVQRGLVLAAVVATSVAKLVEVRELAVADAELRSSGATLVRDAPPAPKPALSGTTPTPVAAPIV